MTAPDDPARRRRRARSAYVRIGILDHLARNPGHHGAMRIHEDAPRLRGVDPAELWPELRALVDRGRIFVSYVEVVQPCHGFTFATRLPVFAHWRHVVRDRQATPPGLGGEVGDG